MFPILRFGREQLARLVSDHNNAAKTVVSDITKVIEVKGSEISEVDDDDIMDEEQKHAQTY